MNTQQAEELIIRLENKSFTTKEEEFQLVEAIHYLFDETKDAKCLAYLGGYYYGQRKFELALKYYEMALELGYKKCSLYLGYVWYYGRTGIRDYKLAYEYFMNVITCNSKQIDKDEKREASLKLADMYKNGYYVNKDYDRYKQIINDLYDDMDYTKDHNVFDKYIEVGLRKARIFEEEENTPSAIMLYYCCKDELAIRLRHNLFFGDINQMDWTINDIYRLVEFDSLDFDLYDLFYLLKEEHIVSFRHYKDTYTIESKLIDGIMNISLNNTYYKSFNDLLLKGNIKGESLSYLYNELDNFEVIKWNK